MKMWLDSPTVLWRFRKIFYAISKKRVYDQANFDVFRTTAVVGMNKHGQIVGYYIDTGDRNYGYSAPDRSVTNNNMISPTLRS
jgi:hypothetical protein